MKRMLSSLICLLWILLSLTGCNVTTSGIEATLGQEFSLSIGQEASITGENLRVSFVDVIDDSRCPEGAICIWEGEVSSLVEITYSGSTSSKVLVQPGIPGRSEAEFADYLITFDCSALS